MAQGDRWQLAIAYPIMNPNFALQNKGTGTLDGNYTSGVDLDSVNGVTPDQGSGNILFLDLVFKVNDRIEIGPSNNTTDLNKSESALISSFREAVNPNLGLRGFVLSSDLTFDYSAGDNWSGKGSALAGGWFLSGAGSGISRDTQVDVVVGNFDNYAQQIVISNVANSLPLGLRQLLDSSFLEENVLYRFGFVYKFINAASSSGSELFRVDIDGQTNNIGTTEELSFISKSIELTKSSWSATPYVEFTLTNPGQSDASFKLTLTVDETYFEHTFNDLEDKRTIVPTGNNGFEKGYYEFTEDPDLGSLKITKRNTFQQLTYQDDKRVWFDKSGEGDRIEKYNFGCRFSNVSQSFYDVVLEFQRLQEKGHTVNIHPSVDDLPDVLRGIFKISAVDKNQWDLRLRSFNFEFMEA